MLSREDFVFTIGYDGPAAIIDGRSKRRYGALGTQELAEKGLFRAAYSSALFSGVPKEMEFLIETYNRFAGTHYGSDFPFDRLFGVIKTDVKRAIVL